MIWNLICQAEAIRKILGQDSNRKKREEKLQKKRDEMAQARRNNATMIFTILFPLSIFRLTKFLVQEKAAKSMAMAGNTVRWVLGPAGTTVTFPEAVGLPNIFDSRPCRSAHFDNRLIFTFFIFVIKNGFLNSNLFRLEKLYFCLVNEKSYGFFMHQGNK